MEEVLVLAIVAALVAGLGVTLLVLGAMAFVRTERLKSALFEAHRRIEDLERRRASGEPVAAPAPVRDVQPPAVEPPPADPGPTRGHGEAAAPAPEPAPKPEDRSIPTADDAARRLPDPLGAVLTPPPLAPTEPRPIRPRIDFARLRAAAAKLAPPRLQVPPLPAPPRLDWRWAAGALGSAAVLAAALLAAHEGAPPLAQLTGLALIGLAALVAADWLTGRGLAWQAQASALGGAGALAVGAWLAGGWVGSGELGENATLAGLTGVGVLLLILAPRHGPVLAWSGLGLGLVAPFATPAAAAYALYSGLLLLAAVAFAVALLRPCRGLALAAACGALGWAFAFLWLGMGPNTAAIRAGFFAGLAALTVAAAWEPARAVFDLSPGWARRLWESEPLAVAHLTPVLAALGIVSLLAPGAAMAARVAGPFALADYAMAPTIALVLLVGGMALVAAMRQGLVFVPLALAPIAVLALAAWPNAAPGQAEAYPLLFAAAGSFGLVFSVCGGAMMARNAIPGPGALIGALGPPAALAASYLKGGAQLEPYAWMAAGLVISAINLIALERLARSPDPVARGPAAAFAHGAIAAAACAIAFAAEDLWLGAGLAALVPGVAYLDRRLGLPGLKLIGCALAALALWTLVFSLAPLRLTVGGWPLLNPLLAIYGVAGAALWGAARLYDRVAGRADTLLVQALEAGSLLLGAVLLALQVRHFANDGALSAPYVTLTEFAGHTLAAIAFAAAMAAQFGARPRPLLFWAELTVFAAALVHILLVGLVLLNPWWGSTPGAVMGPPLVDTLLLAFAAPAIALAGYAVLRRRQGLAWRALIAEGAALALGFLWVTLATRRLFHLEDPQGLVVAPSAAEAWALNAAWGLFALGLLAAGVLARRPLLRTLSLAPLAAAFGKGFFLDGPALEGPPIIFGYLALLLALGAAGLLYHRLLFIKGDVTADRLGALLQPRASKA